MPDQNRCSKCKDTQPLGFDITMAFQPIVDLREKRVYGYEALVRGTKGEGAGEILSRISESNRYVFDQTCRIKAIELASKLGLKSRLSINFLPNAVYQPEACIRATLAAAEKYNFPLSQITFEVTESEPVQDPVHLLNIFQSYQSRGFATAIDDFGAGYAGLSLLLDFRPQVIKLDMALCQGIAKDKIKKTITQGIINTARALNIEIVAEGIEILEDLETIRDMGVYLIQGYLFSRPEIGRLAVPEGFSAD